MDRRRCLSLGVGTQGSYRVKQLATVPECRYAKLLQVLRRQAPEDRFVNLVLAEDRLALSEAKAPKPTFEVAP